MNKNHIPDPLFIIMSVALQRGIPVPDQELRNVGWMVKCEMIAQQNQDREWLMNRLHEEVENMQKKYGYRDAFGRTHPGSLDVYEIMDAG